LRPFRLHLGGLGAFPNMRRPRVIWAGMTEGARKLERIAADLEAGLGRLGFAWEKRRFSAHLTLGRTRSARGLNELVRRVKRYSDFDMGDMQVEDVSLFKSDLRPTGPIYTRLFRAGLGGGIQEGGIRS
ncbi:RNA 2',3'-cyclic phosphodiesterase, partial [Thermodesulfobacteriota bacterium]